MEEVRVWASTPEAKAKLAASGGKVERKKAPCPAMKKAQEQAARVSRELAEEREAREKEE
jgi:hypothetical protein